MTENLELREIPEVREVSEVGGPKSDKLQEEEKSDPTLPMT